MSSKNILLGENLTLVSVLRQSVIDASFVCSCDNCGQTIVNIATVENDNGIKFNIGLDCKRTLIDNDKIKQLINSDPIFGKYEAKEYKSKLNTVEKFLTYFSDQKRYSIETDGKEIFVYDTEKIGILGFGFLNIFCETIPFLNSLGLKQFIIDAYNAGKIKRD